MNDIQHCIFNIYKEVYSILEKEGIQMYALGGTCLGAVRHKGFIPWDDDMDVGVPVEQYDRMIDILKNRMPNHLRLYLFQDVQTYPYFFSKIVDERTTYIEEVDYPYPDSYKGIWIDIFPLRGIPHGKFKRKTFELLEFYYFHMNQRLRTDITGSKLLGKIIWWIIKPFRKILPYNYYSTKWIKMIKKYPINESDAVGYCFNPAWFKKTNFSKMVLGEGRTVQFEDSTILVPQNSHEYLFNCYGDYMKLPPIDKQITHHNGIVKIDTPYKRYKDNPDLLYSEK